MSFMSLNAQKSQPSENSIKEPVKRVHNDFTDKSGYSRARRELEVIIKWLTAVSSFLTISGDLLNGRCSDKTDFAILPKPNSFVK
jgi:hypothetical protein